MAAEEYSPDPFDESPPKEMKYLVNPQKMTMSKFEKIPKKLIESKKLETGKIYYIENVSRRKKDYREVYQGMYFPDPDSKDNDTLTFKYVSIIVAPFGEGGMPFGFPKKNHKFYEATSIPSKSDHSRFKDNIKDMKTFIETQKVAPVEKGVTNISFIGEEYQKAKKDYEKTKGILNTNTTGGSKKTKNKSKNRKRKTYRKRKK